MRATAGLFWVLCLAVSAGQATSQAAPLRRVSGSGLRIPTPGVAVIRDSAAWVALWQRFEQTGQQDTGIVHPPVPNVNFRRNMLVAVSLGQSYEVYSPLYVRSVVERRDSIVVVLWPKYENSEIDWSEMTKPVDIVLLRRSAKPVAFHTDRPSIATPPRAPWLDRPSPAELDAMPLPQRAVLLLALARDRATPLTMLEVVAQRLDSTDWQAAADLLLRPETYSSAAILIVLARHRGRIGEEARDSLFARHALALALDTATTSDVLMLLVDHLGGRGTNYQREVASQLLRHPTLRGDRRLLTRYVGLLHYSQRDLSEEACRVYLAQWSPWILHENGDKPYWYSDVWCDKLPPEPK